MHAAWPATLAVYALIADLVCALWILLDIAVPPGRPQTMKIMNVTWPVAGLYLGPIAVAAYYWFGRANRDGATHKTKPYWQSVFVDCTHCGGGCATGDVIGEWGVFISGASIAGIPLWPEYIADFSLAYVFGIAFQYFAIAPIKHLPPGRGLLAAVKADTISLTAYEVGMFAWMALAFYVVLPPHTRPTTPLYWLSMQIGMIVGFVTSFPANWYLVKKGIKERM